ncbi:MAG: mechanosensitive ion channel [Treponema sp.]|jgi:small conductance mechanosensitive channel|nr:mechanosensitive ion channel [Treponema sp.]
MYDTMSRFWDNYSNDIFSLVQKIVVALVIIIAGMMINHTLKKIINRTVQSRIHLDETIASLLRIILRYALFIICLIMILQNFGFNTASLLAILGAAAVAVGLALKDTLGNIAAGIILLFLRSYGKGDFIEFGAFMGTVKEIGLFTTILETPDGIFISAPNSSIWNVPLKNYTRNGKRRMDFSVGISYGDSIDEAFKMMQDIVAGEDRFLKSPAPQIVVQSLGESSVNICLRAWADNSVYWNIYWDQMRNIRGRIESAGLRIAFPRRDIHIIDGKGQGRDSGAGPMPSPLLPPGEVP